MIKLVYLILLLILLFSYIKYFERRSIFFPSKGIEITPKDIGLSYEEVRFKTKDNIALAGWFIPHDETRATVLFCHGNGGNISHRLHKIKMFHNLKLGVFIFDYRGYGQSHGSPSEKGLYRDVEAAYYYLVKDRKIAAKKILLFGESLGSAPAIDLGAKKELSGLIIEGGFSSAKDMAKRIYPLIPTFVYTIRFDSFAKIKNIKVPKLFFHSKSDEVVPFELGKKLFKKADEPKEFVEIVGAHNTAFLDSQKLIIEKIDEFLKGS